MQDDREHLVRLIASLKTAMGSTTLEKDVQSLTTADLYRLAEDLRSTMTLRLSENEQAGTYSRLEGKLGKIILDGINHDIPVWHALKAFLRFFRRDFSESRRVSRLNRANIHAETAGPSELAILLSDNGIDPIKTVIDRIKATRQTDPILAGQYASSVASNEMTDLQSIFIAFALYQGGDVKNAAAMLESISSEKFNQKQAGRRDRILSEADYLQYGAKAVVAKIIEDLSEALSETGNTDIPANAEFRMAYVAASTLPYNKVGYTTRTHRIVSAIKLAANNEQSDLVVVARPGFPFDRFDLNLDTLGDELESEVDGIKYHYLKTNIPMQDGLIHYTLEAAYKLTEFFVNNNIRAVTAASNHVSALPAYVAARALKLPFTYEVRGLWEETKASKLTGWDQSERFMVDRMMEEFIIQNADNTFFITRQVRELFFPPSPTLEDQNGNTEQITDRDTAFLAPNCAVLDNSLPILSAYTDEPKDVINLLYIGSLVEYEGLQTVLASLHDMEEREKFRVTIVGGGKFARTLSTLTSEYGLEDIVKFTGRVEPEKVTEYYEMADIILVPRLPHRVCQLVSPLKPLEAMSYRRLCLASDVAPIADLISDEKTGFMFKAGDQNDLAKTLLKVYSSQDRFSEMADAAYQYIVENRDWRAVGRDIYKVNRLTAGL